MTHGAPPRGVIGFRRPSVDVVALNAEGKETASVDRMASLQYSVHNRTRGTEADITFQSREMPPTSVVWAHGGTLARSPVQFLSVGTTGRPKRSIRAARRNEIPIGELMVNIETSVNGVMRRQDPVKAVCVESERLHYDHLTCELHVETDLKILVLAADATAEDPAAAVDREAREIRVRLDIERRRRTDCNHVSAVRCDEVRRQLMDYRPQLVHFCGHGNCEGIILTNASDNPTLLSNRALGALFRVLGAGVKCVVLNSCLSGQQAAGIARHVQCVVGTSCCIEDSAAVEFAKAFYDAVASGQSVGSAFELARDASGELGGHANPTDDAYVLVPRKGVDPYEMVLVAALPRGGHPR